MVKDPTALIAHIVSSSDAAKATYDQAEVFTGPSLHFHHQALKAGLSDDAEAFAQMAYALLVSWGMHRMGPKGPKMNDFSTFAQSIAEAAARARSLRGLTPVDLRDAEWRVLEGVFLTLRPMRSSSSLVATSKVMAHWLPTLVAPIDRQYTLAFVGRRTVPASLDGQCKLFRSLHQDFFYPLIKHDGLRERIYGWVEPSGWHTSSLKVADNLVIGAQRLARE